MGNYDLIKLSQARQRWGTEKYKDNDKFRSVAHDLIEECQDQINIAARRKHWLVYMGYDEDIIDAYTMLEQALHKTCLEQFEIIKKIDKLMKAIKYPTKDVKRVWFDDE